MLQIAQKFRQIELQFADAFPQSAAVDELHRDEVHAARFADLINVRDVWMIESGGRSGLLKKPPHAIFAGREVRRQNLQRNLAAKMRVLRQIDLAHAAFVNFRADFVVAKTFTGRNGHLASPAWNRPRSLSLALTFFHFCAGAGPIRREELDYFFSQPSNPYSTVSRFSS